MNTDTAVNIEYPPEVISTITQTNLEEYIIAAERLNAMEEVKIVVIQHEFGIFGGESGSHILAFLDHLTKPVLIAFHTVLPHPSETMLRVTRSMCEKADRLVVMTNQSKMLLGDVYGAAAEKIRVIPHGTHPQPYTARIFAKTRLGLSGKLVLSTFGLLGRGKGIEYAIRALPSIVAQYPNTVYLVLGATHPIVARQEGEAYRRELETLAHELGVENHVVFHNKYFETLKLLEYLQATDVYLSLSQNPDQAVSGTLAYALGTGRPVISTAFMQAQEIITPEVGVLVEFGEAGAIAREVLHLFGDEARLESMSKAAYFRTRSMTWPNVALSYMREFIALAPSLATGEDYFPAIKLDHVQTLTDDFGMFQFAVLDAPDPMWGYTLDDNARALVAMAWSEVLGSEPAVSALADTYLRFLEHAAKEDGHFENYFAHDAHAPEFRPMNENLEDSDARAMWALAVAAHAPFQESLKQRAQKLFWQQFTKQRRSNSPRAVAFHIKAMSEFLAVDEHGELQERLIAYADFLVDLFIRSSENGWQWFEEALTYSNGVLPEALWLAYERTGNEQYKTIASLATNFLIEHSFQGEVCVPVGQAGWFRRGSKKQLYDQQPEEVCALILVLATAARIAPEFGYGKKMELAFDWFLGNNTLGQVIYSQMNGGCYDGLGEKEINLNQGAESTLSYLLARLAMEQRAAASA